MTEKVLFVDDDQKVLNGIERQFQERLEFETANCPRLALEMLETSGPFAVVVSDMRMPELSGIEFLTRVRERSPETVRIMLTGHADLQATIEAVNEGNVFRFLSKPCPADLLERSIRDGLAQYRLVTAERELLEGTLHGCIKVLSEMLSLVNPLAFGRTTRVQGIALEIAAHDERIQDTWSLKIAGMLFPLGCVTVSENALECALNGRPIPAREQAAFAQHPMVAQKMLRKIPRLDQVADIVAFHDRNFDGSGNPGDSISGEEVPIGARILKVASEFEIAYRKSDNAMVAWEELTSRSGRYDPVVIESLLEAIRNGLCHSSRREVTIGQLAVGMHLAVDVRSFDGKLMLTGGQEVTESIRQRLCKLCMEGVIGKEFHIQTPRTEKPFELASI